MGLSNSTDCSALPVARVLEEPYGLYPGVESFTRDYGAGDYRGWVEESNGDPLPAPLALYIQDANDRACVAGVEEKPTAHRLSAIEQELRLLGSLFDTDRPVQQLVCAGDIARQWSDDQLYQLISVVQESFFISQGATSSWCACAGKHILSNERLRLLRVLGFSGVRFLLQKENIMQDVLDELGLKIESARNLGFENIVLDILPCDAATEPTMRLIERFLGDARPDRIRLLDGLDDRAYSEFGRLLGSLQYINIGMDWFLKSSDQWLHSKAADRLHWSLLGFTEMSHPDVIGVGPGAISSIGFFYGINDSKWSQYQARLDQGELPIVAGIELESDDILRREIMGMILSGSCIRVTSIEEKWGISFRQFFAWESDRLQLLGKKNWLDWRADTISIRVRGAKELIELCRIFDRRRRQAAALPELSLV